MVYFASLQPYNLAAIRAFHNVCEAIVKYPDEYSYHSRYIRRQEAKVSTQEALDQSLSSLVTGSFSSGTTLEDEEGDRMLVPVYTGSFVFDFERLPAISELGWQAGHGRWESDKNAGVEFLLALPKDGKASHLRGKHILFNFIKDSGCFGMHTLTNNNWTSIGARRLTVNDKYIPFTETQHLLTLGDLVYLFQYRVEDETLFQAAKKGYMTKHMRLEAPIVHASVTPTQNDMRISGWSILGTAGAGTEGTVRAAIAEDGQLAVVKSFKRLGPRDNKAKEAMECLQKQLDKTEGQIHVLRLLQFLVPRNEVRGEIFALYSPLARGDFQNILLKLERDIPLSTIQKLFAQVIHGIQAIHQAGYAHRDIKPMNLAILRLNPPHALVIDLGQTKKTNSGYEDKEPTFRDKPGTIGTIGYHAPEVEGISNYGQLADIWALGCVGVQIFFLEAFEGRVPWIARVNPFNPWRNPDSFGKDKYAPTEDDLEEKKGQFRSFRNALLMKSDDVPRSLLQNMLDESPEGRPSASHALRFFDHIDWRPIVEKNTGMKRGWQE